MKTSLLRYRKQLTDFLSLFRQKKKKKKLQKKSS